MLEKKDDRRYHFHGKEEEPKELVGRYMVGAMLLMAILVLWWIVVTAE